MLEITLSLTVFDIHDIFDIHNIFPNSGNSTCFRGTVSVVPNGSKIC